MTPETQKTLAMTADNVGRSLLEALVQEIKLLPDVWPKLSKRRQDDVIDRLRNRVAENVKMAVHTIAADERVTVVADLDQVVRKGGIKAVFKINSGSPGRHVLFDSEGMACLIVLVDPEKAVAGMDEVQGEADQRAMDLGHEYDPNADGQDMAGDVVDAEFIATPDVPMSELDAAHAAGYVAAEAGEPESACPIMRGELCIEWVKGWKAWHEQHPATEGAEG